MVKKGILKNRGQSKKITHKADNVLGFQTKIKNLKLRGVQPRKGMMGEGAWYCPKSVAIKKLQITESEFDRLCILKGVHPREPKNKFRRHHEPFYHMKDLQYLKRDDLLSVQRINKSVMTRFKKFMNRRELDRAQSYIDWKKPFYSLAASVKERYATVEDAIKDAGSDCLSVFALVASLPADRETNIKSKHKAKAAQLLNEFKWLVQDKKLLTACFISRKGFYFQASIKNILITWVEPHDFVMDTSAVVDFSTVSNFLEFYLTLWKFVNYHLYTESGLQYPPKIAKKYKEEELGFYALTPEMKVVENNLEDESDGDDSSSEQEDVYNPSESDDKQEEEAEKLAEINNHNHNLDPKRQTVFEGSKVIICREVPFKPISFVLACGGAEIGWQSPTSETLDIENTKVTHMISDRPALPPRLANAKYMKGRQVVQPQWVFDSFNQAQIQSTNLYGLGVSLPVHLSPFAEDDAEVRKIAESISDEGEDLDERNLTHQEENRFLQKSMLEGKSKYQFKKLKEQAKKKLGK